MFVARAATQQTSQYERDTRRSMRQEYRLTSIEQKVVPLSKSSWRGMFSVEERQVRME